MKRKIWLPLLTCILFISASLLPGCMKDKVTRTYQVSTPIFEVLSKFREQIKSQPAKTVENPGKLTRYGQYIFLSDLNKGIHVIDNSNPAAPKYVSFINIPGNEDLAIKGNTLYADAFADLVTMDISNPLDVVAKDFIANAFPDRSMYYGGIYLAGNTFNPDSVNVIVGYYTRDTTVEYFPDQVYPPIYLNCANCSVFAMANAVPNKANTQGTNGSMARFSIINNYLYTVGYSNLTSFDISQPFSPSMKSTQQVDFHVETIYPLKNNLFVGTNNGMYMYDVLLTPYNPKPVGEFTHIRACDPVVADDNYAYVTLNDSSACMGSDDQLQIVDIRNMSNPFLVKAYQLVHPMGLSKDGEILFLCDGKDGLKIYNAADPNNLVMIKQFSDGNVYDVIAENGLATVMASDGIYQYDYSDMAHIHLISKL